MYETARSIRSLGMGGVYIPIVKDTDALFYNPAALGRLDGMDIQLINVGLGANITDPEKISALTEIDPSDPTTFNALFGEKYWFGGAGKVAVAVPYFGVGYFTDYSVELELHNPAFPEFQTYFLNDSGFVVGGAVAILPNTYLGMNFKKIVRWGGTVQDLGLDAIVGGGTSMEAIGNSFDSKGTGYGLDLALTTELPFPLKPTFAIVWQNVGDVAFTKTAGTEAPPHIHQNLSIGAGMDLDLPGLDIAVGAEARHLTDYDVQLGKKLHIGAEISLPILDFRAGYSQGYLSYGVGVNLLVFRLDAVSYTEELGVYPGQTADNRYLIGLSIDLSFDANFNFQDNNGKRRKLKQRR